MFLNHSAGLPALKSTLPKNAFYDWELMTKYLEEAEPWWEPGTDVGYHGMSKGWLCGEIIRRVTLKTVGKFLREEITEPLGIDFWIGLPEEYDRLVATMIFAEQGDPPADFYIMVVKDPEGIQSKLFTNDGGHFTTAFQTRAALAAEIPAAGGVANARGLAGIYAPLACGGKLGDVDFVDKDTLARAASL